MNPRSIRIMACLALSLLLSAPLGAQTRSTDTLVQVPFNLSLVPAVSIANSVADGKPTETNLSFTIIGGTSHSLQGIHYGGIWQRYTGEISGISSGVIVTITDGEVHGLQSSGIININRSPFSGAQTTGIVNYNTGCFSGVQAAGIINTGTDKFSGMQVAGIVNNTNGPFSGAQISGIINTGADHVRGYQWSGIINMASDSFKGFQWAGIANTTGEFSGFQWAGIANRATSLNTGLQIGGIVNIANTVGHEAIQIAPVNITMHNEGIPIGPVSYVRDHGSALDLWVDEAAFLTTGFRTGNDRFYNIISLGAQLGDPTRWATGWTFGGAAPLNERTCIAIDAGIRHINEEGDTWTSGLNNQLTFRLLGCRDITDHITISAGPTLNYFRSRVHDGEDLASWEIYDETDHGKYHRIWPGFVFGLTIR